MRWRFQVYVTWTSPSDVWMTAGSEFGAGLVLEDQPGLPRPAVV